MNNFKYGSLVELDIHAKPDYRDYAPASPIRGVVVDDNPVFMLDCTRTYSLCYKVSIIDHDNLKVSPSMDRAFLRENPGFDEKEYEKLPEEKKNEYAKYAATGASSVPEKFRSHVRVCEFSHREKKPATVFYISGSHLKLISE